MLDIRWESDEILGFQVISGAIENIWKTLSRE